MRITPRMKEAGTAITDCCYQASIDKSGIVGKTLDLNEYPWEYRDLIWMYVNDLLSTVEVIYIAMRRAKD